MNERIRPQRLQVGDTIGIVSPSSPVAAFVPRRLERGINHLRELGFQVVLGNHATKRKGHTAGTIEERVEDLHEMFADPNVKAIITTIGGFNSHQLLDELDYDLIRRNPKILMGYSDITAVLSAIRKETGLVTFLGPAILPQIGEFGGMQDYTRRAFEKTLMHAQPAGLVESSKLVVSENLMWDEDDDRPRGLIAHEGMKLLKPGRAKGPVVSGNLGTMLLLSGTKYFPDMEGAILCVEDDEGETPSTVDRYFTQLRHLGVYDKIAGLLVGRFAPSVGFSENDSLESLLLQATRGYDFPIVTDADFGHLDPMFVLPNGIEAEVDACAGEEPRFSLLEAAVE